MSDTDATQIIDSAGKGDVDRINYLLFLQPSFPPEVGKTNRSLLLKGLSKLAKRDESKWRMAIEYILKDWKGVHKLAKKHFNIAPKERDRILLGGFDDESHKVIGVVDKSPDIMSLVMREILESTNKASEKTPQKVTT